MGKYLVFLFFVLFQLDLSAQSSKLADQYFRSGEYEKSAQLYKTLYKKQKNNDFFFNRYLESLIAMESYAQAERDLKNEIKIRPNDYQLYVSYGNLYERQEMSEKADAMYRRAIQKITTDVSKITRMGNAFTKLGKYELAIETYLRGEEILQRPDLFSYNMADLYRRKGDNKKMIEYYLNSAGAFKGRLASLKTIFQRELQEADFKELQAQLYERIQEDPENVEYPELLQWTFITRKEYTKALRQARAMDRRLEENGNRVFRIAEIAENAGDYNTAIKAFEYIISNKGANTSYYLEAKRGLLNTKKKQITRDHQYAKEDLLALEAEYESFLDEFGRNRLTAPLLKELATLEALYLDNLDKAIVILEEMVGFAGVNKFLVADAKLDLGDYYLMKEDIWESSLLYSQVDKEFKEGHLGELARFRNARLAYYNGNFEWSQAQFDILKASTSKLISNDAIDMSVFIMDNMGLDTTDVPLKMYAETDLLIFQNKYDEALDKLKEIENTFPEHSLTDDILYSRAQIFKNLKDYTSAIEMYDRIIENHVEEIRCDNAIFELAELYENILGEPDKARDLYEKLFLDFSNSTYAIEARKRFRILRGDEI